MQKDQTGHKQSYEIYSQVDETAGDNKGGLN